MHRRGWEAEQERPKWRLMEEAPPGGSLVRALRGGWAWEAEQEKVC